MGSMELIRRLEGIGWIVRGGKKKNSGSHITLKKTDVSRIITFPHPRKDISKGILRQVQEISGLSLL
ncbi:type II toxin-antitoxin system HicA family toxin [Edaphovirga cremea]|jgi:predicted RNA binding protein YcfA (HicA-like mRNA interferase family)|uniref:type II toxin-antitoxin system HicA family toxin n=1 Tax=Edaphovirga cremea TaxID=2267246 RepID=UPI000DEEDC6A|nr:type II toxin-antitoxin system HicA family toxin [Edaphovirga cremea]